MLPLFIVQPASFSWCFNFCNISAGLCFSKGFVNLEGFFLGGGVNKLPSVCRSCVLKLFLNHVLSLLLQESSKYIVGESPCSFCIPAHYANECSTDGCSHSGNT